MKDSYTISNITLNSRLWACTAQNFLFASCSLPIDIAEQVIRESETDILITYIPSIDEFVERKSSFRSIEELKDRLRDRRYIELVCTNLSKSSEEAVEKAKRGMRFCKAQFIKLEVIDNKRLNNSEVLKAVESLVSIGYKNIIPFVTANIDIIRELVKLCVPAIRVLASEIGSNRGINNPDMIRRICTEFDIPVIIEGGIGHARHAKEAMLLGATAILVNSAIVKGNDPVAMAKTIKRAVLEGRNEYLSKNKIRHPVAVK